MNIISGKKKDVEKIASDGYVDEVADRISELYTKLHEPTCNEVVGMFTDLSQEIDCNFKGDIVGCEWGAETTQTLLLYAKKLMEMNDLNDLINVLSIREAE